jgi:hypothetical protein
MPNDYLNAGGNASPSIRRREAWERTEARKLWMALKGTPPLVVQYVFDETVLWGPRASGGVRSAHIHGRVRCVISGFYTFFSTFNGDAASWSIRWDNYNANIIQNTNSSQLISIGGVSSPTAWVGVPATTGGDNIIDPYEVTVELDAGGNYLWFRGGDSAYGDNLGPGFTIDIYDRPV